MECHVCDKDMYSCFPCYVSDIEGWVLKEVVDYLYTGLPPPRGRGDSELSQTLLLLSAARRLQISSLVSICQVLLWILNSYS